MPRLKSKIAGRIVLALRGKETITDEDIDEQLHALDIWGQRSIDEYHEMLKAQYLERTPGGWTLKPESRKDAEIVIRVSPARNAGEVLRRLDVALNQFRPLITIEMEA